MIYKNFQDLQLSALGLGAMRLPVIDGNDAQIDEAAAARMVDLAMEQGVNYYDTAWGYHGGNSELVLGRALKRHPRDRFYLADKFPGYDLSNMGKVEEIFEEQLRKCQVDYFDFYLFHNVCEMNIDAYLDPKYGIFDYLMKQKENGRIRHLGFSAHGSLEVMKRFLDAYGKHMEFCQIQLNYLDWTFQNARGKVELLNQWNIPVWVMEPLRGLQSVSGVTMILSGMSSEEQMRDNLHTFETDRPLAPQELEALRELTEEMLQVVPCTACHYCVSHCPQGLDIPRLLELYNEHHFTGGGFIAPMVLMSVPQEKHPSACVGCRSCEAVCPQQIKISEALADFAQKLG